MDFSLSRKEQIIQSIAGHVAGKGLMLFHHRSTDDLLSTYTRMWE